MAQRPDYGGHAWVFLQYLLGFRRLGYEPLFIDWLTRDMATDDRGRPSPAVHAASIRWLAEVMDRFGLDGSYILLLDDGSETVGLTRTEALERVRRSVLLVNVMGFLSDEELLAAAPRRVFLDIDPGFPQMWRELGLADTLTGHDVFVTIAQNIGEVGCTIPTCGLAWQTTRQPVVLAEWPARPKPGAALTTIGSWRGPHGPIEYDGRTYGLRVHEFRKLVDLPRATGQRFEAALDIDPADATDIDLLTEHGWTLVDPRATVGSTEEYRRYIQHSRGEFMVPKNMYVETRSGWFSDRSVCYLASAKPVLARDTGLDGLYPLGDGLLAFTTPEEAINAVGDVYRRPDVHAQAARSLAEEYFDSDKVLGRLLSIVG
jgi:hypothetical protein